MMTFGGRRNDVNVMMAMLRVTLFSPVLISCFVAQISPNAPRGYSTTVDSVPSPVLADVVEEARNMMPEIVGEMPEPIPGDLKNKYYFLRHGQSTANVAEIISSSRSLSYSKKHGLTQFGYEQGKQSSVELLDALESEGTTAGDKVVMVSSPFARAKETAEACLDGLAENEQQERIRDMGVDISTEIVLENKLMERYFGRLDAEAIYTYAYVWPLDKFNVTHTAFDVESVAAVCTRIREVVMKLENEYEGYHLVLVSHADVLQIAQLYAANVDNVGVFSSYRFKNGEVRSMKRTPDSLPPPSALEAPQRGTGM